MKYHKKKFVVLLLILVASLSLLLGGFLLLFREYSSTDTYVDKNSSPTVIQQESLEDMSIGETSAPITIIEYASLTCSHCADFHREVLPSIHEKYIIGGKVRFIFREFASDPRAVAGFMLARCVEKDLYFPFLQVLFEKQLDWAFVPDSKTPLLKVSRLAGLDEEKILACLSDQNRLDKLNGNVRRAEGLGIMVTPTFFINGKKYEGAMNLQNISSIIDNILQK